MLTAIPPEEFAAAKKLAESMLALLTSSPTATPITAVVASSMFAATIHKYFDLPVELAQENVRIAYESLAPPEMH